jgi:hypothetical protein
MSGKRGISLEMLDRLAEVLGLDVVAGPLGEHPGG